MEDIIIKISYKFSNFSSFETCYCGHLVSFEDKCLGFKDPYNIFPYLFLLTNYLRESHEYSLLIIGVLETYPVSKYFSHTIPPPLHCAPHPYVVMRESLEIHAFSSLIIDSMLFL